MPSVIIADSIRRFRQNRVETIARGSAPVELVSSAKTVIHLVPLSPDGHPTHSDTDLAQRILAFLSSHKYGSNERGTANQEGFLFYTSDWYVQVFPTGTIEVVETGLMKTCAEGNLISSPDYEVACTQCVRSHLVAQWCSFFNVNTQPRVAVMITLLGVSGFAMNRDSFRGLRTPGSNRIDESVVVLPEVILENSGENLLENSRPVWDGLWRAAGWECSPHYSPEGHWVPDWSHAAV
jgi:hypothetical protein